jgi:hypothetical protein
MKAYGEMDVYIHIETSVFVASYDSQGHSGGIRPRLHTGLVPLKFYLLI